MSFAVLFHFLCAQHVSDINISIIRSLQAPNDGYINVQKFNKIASDIKLVFYSSTRIINIWFCNRQEFYD